MSQKKVKFTAKDKLYMDIALDLAKSREGLTGTNPSVGCVIVKNDNIISIGQTSFKGRPHAEVNAIKNCKDNLNGAKMYVTLEPCSHHGVTPPCTNEIIKSKISEVIYSIEDTDKRVRKKSYKILKSYNINVSIGLLKDQVKKFYIPYFFNRRNKMPFMTGKLAISKNKLIYSKFKTKITNKYSDKFSHLLRYKNDSIMVTSQTVNIDNPKLNCRINGFEKFSPVRIILDNKLNLKTNSYIFKTANMNNTVIFYNEASKSKILLFKKKKIKLEKVKLKKRKNLDIRQIMKKLYLLGYRNTLVEGGDLLSTNFLKNRIFNQFYLFKSQKKLPTNFECVKFNGLQYLNKKYTLKINHNSPYGKDKITLYKN